MSDPVTNLEIEDVLSSIRRLVAEGDKLRSTPLADVPHIDVGHAPGQHPEQPSHADIDSAASMEGPMPEFVPEPASKPVAPKFVLTSALRVDTSPKPTVVLWDDGQDDGDVDSDAADRVEAHGGAPEALGDAFEAEAEEDERDLGFVEAEPEPESDGREADSEFEPQTSAAPEDVVEPEPNPEPVLDVEVAFVPDDRADVSDASDSLAPPALVLSPLSAVRSANGPEGSDFIDAKPSELHASETAELSAESAADQPSGAVIDPAPAGEPEEAHQSGTSDVGRESRSRLETTIAELEAAINGKPEEWEPDGSEATPVMDWASTLAEPAFLTSRNGIKSGTIEDAEEVVEDVVEEARPFVLSGATTLKPASIDTPDDVEATEAATYSEVSEGLGADLARPDTEALDGELNETLTAYLEEEEILDEETLRNLVVEIVSQELQGALGERITRNVRKLVRREIHRVLSSQEFD